MKNNSNFLRYYKNKNKLKTYLILIILFKILLNVDALYAVPCSFGETGGIIFRDYNYNGIQDGVDRPWGLANLLVTAYSDQAAILTSSIDINGNYTFGIIEEAYFPIRIELTNIPSYLKEAAIGLDSSSSVVFIEANSCNVNFGLSNPRDFCQSDPTISVACYESGSGVDSNAAGLVSYPYTYTGIPPGHSRPATGFPPNVDDQVQNIGSVYGNSFQRSRGYTYHSSFIKRHVGFGPEGIGGIYVYDYNQTPALQIASFSLQNIIPENGGPAIDLGFVNRTNVLGPISAGVAGDFELPQASSEINRDLDAYAKVGKMGYGGNAVTEDESYLWLVNLNQIALIQIDISGSITNYPNNVKQYLLSDLSGIPICDNGIFRPWAIHFYDGLGYLGGVCTGELLGTNSDLYAYVLSFDPNQIDLGFNQEINFPLNYIRERPWQDLLGPWYPWSDLTSVFLTPGAIFNNLVSYPTPILSSLAFSEDGSMNLAFTDRLSHQFGYAQYWPLPGNLVIRNGIPAGDLIKVCKNNGTWQLEGNINCPVPSNPGVAGNDSVNRSDDGPSGTGEFFYQDNYLTFHGELSLGSILVVPGTEEVFSIVFDPVDDNPPGAGFYTNGHRRFSSLDGSLVGSYEVVPSLTIYLGKASGLGHPTALCDSPPIEIGNRLWVDLNANGIQDPGEPPLANVELHLYEEDTLVGITLTDISGNYIFNNSNVNLNGASGIISNFSSSNNSYYTIIIPNISGPNKQNSLSGLFLTYNDQGLDNNFGEPADIRDSDFLPNLNNSAIFEIPASSINLAGYNNFSFDAGFILCENPNVVEQQIGLDNSAKILKDLVKKSAITRFNLAKRNQCEKLRKKRLNTIINLADVRFNQIWTDVWSMIKNNYYICLDMIVPQICQSTNIDEIKNSLLNQAKKLSIPVYRTLKKCQKQNRANRALRKRNKILNQFKIYLKSIQSDYSKCN